MKAHLAAWVANEVAVVGEGRLDLGRERVPDALLPAPDTHRLPVRITETQPDAHTRLRSFLEHARDVRVRLREEGAREHKHVNLLHGAQKQGEPHIAWDARPVGVGVDELRAGRAEPLSPLAVLGPQVCLVDPQQVRDRPTVPTVGDSATDPPAGGLGIHGAGFGQLLHRQATLHECGTQSLIHSGKPT
ncbi:hypothetical protein GCM10009601_62950 [Streptomyces thermospinosisporus]|uniref:Uncharacterized protein n=1 Tax=Streptomyces thermospinosisporus TaxID=161482 RepID=A0ABN1Z7N5_9ACTN